MVSNDDKPLDYKTQITNSWGNGTEKKGRSRSNTVMERLGHFGDEGTVTCTSKS